MAFIEIRNLWKDVLNFELDQTSQAESQMFLRLWQKADTFAAELGLSGNFGRYPLHAKSINTIQRLRPDGSLQRQIAAEIVQSENLALETQDPNGPRFRKDILRYTIS
jgi:hypothetical protein